MKKTSSDHIVKGPLDTAAEFVSKVKGTFNSKTVEIWRRLDWTDPSVAFYGETNAGKSTLIEALLILFGSAGEKPGEAIGDGSPDFTREAASYPCMYGGARFNLLDVPGIEGDEAQVAAEIEGALHRAHVVFYVTADARPPQGGDEGRAGTLEKIKRQLKPQAKVWAVYNKKLNNPRQISASLANDDEKQSLSHGKNSLDGKMREVLGLHYQGHFVLSALPGFLALGDNLPPDSRFLAQREKFLLKVSAADLLAFSRVAEFGTLLRSKIPTRNEIAQANINKLLPLITAAVDQLEQLSEKHFAKPARELGKQLKILGPELKLIADDASKAVSRLTDEVTNGCIMRVRKEMLQSIDQGLSGDDALKKKLEQVLSEERARLPETVNGKVSNAAQNVHRSCREALQLVEKYLKDVRAFDSPTFASSFSHAVEVNTSSGIDWLGVAGTAAVVVAAVMASGVTAVIVGIGALLSAIRSVWNFFSDQHQKDQQKKSLNETLDAIKPKLRTDVKQMLQRVETDLRKHVLDMMDPLESVEKNFQVAANFMKEAASDLENLAENPAKLCRYAEVISSSG